ncbi:MAG: VWA domain-containing protein [Gemmatimonadaceae bacterium]
MPADLVAHCVRFCRALRDRGVDVTPAETVLATRALGQLDVGDREDVRLGLRSALILQREQYQLFDDTFDEVWGGGGQRAKAPPGSSSKTVTSTPPTQPRPQSAVTMANWMKGPQGAHEERVPVRQPSDRESLGSRDFSSFGNEQAAAFERLARRIARRLSLRPSRRWEAAARGTRIDMRRTIRGSLRTGGDVVSLEWRRRKIRRTKLVAVCDVSGSMELYARFLLQFLHALQNTFANIETFVFSTRLTRTTDVLRHARWAEALSGIARNVTDWSGGTRIGASLAQFASAWLSLVDRRTVVLVLSDGWETGDPAILGDAMRTLHARAGRVIWLNPLMGSSDFAPETRGMQAALPHLDVLAPAHNIESLEQLVRHLVI